MPTLACAYRIAAGAVFPEHFGQPLGVFGQMLERHRAVLDERHRLAVAFHRHHDVEAGLAHFPQRLLRLRGFDPHDRVGQAEVADQLGQAIETRRLRGGIFAGELDQQDSPRARRLMRARSPDGMRDSLAPDRSSCDRPARPRSA
jgi:hypothetical protein